MLSRRHLRIKVMQAIYAMNRADGVSMKEGEDFLKESLSMIHDLYIHQLSFLVEFIDFANVKIEDAKLKYLPTEEDLNPNTRFIDNRFIKQLSQNKEFNLRRNNLKISWADEQEMIRKLYNIFKGSDEYQAYMSAEKNDYEADKDILIKFVKRFAGRYELLESFYEAQSVFWADDFDTANMMVIKTLKLWKESYDEMQILPGIYNTKGKADPKEDEKFVYSLFRKTLLNGDKYFDIISENVKNWDSDRIAMLDMLILKMAATEFEFFPSIPIKVTINEYLEISKIYSTEKSKTFINGVLEKIMTYLKENERLNKFGRGLLN